jgi:hypothetical protein
MTTFLVIGIVVMLYMAAAEVVKKSFYKKMKF